MKVESMYGFNGAIEQFEFLLAVCIIDNRVRN